MIYIYTLSDSANNIRYVGKTNNIKNRLKTHISSSKNRKTHKDHWIQNLLKLGLKPELHVIDETESNWEFLEQYWISQFKAWGFKLVNHTEGGDNPPILKSHSKETKEKLSLIKKEFFKNNPHHRLGIKHTEEHKNKIRETRLGRQYVITDEHRSNMSVSHLKIGNSECYQYNMDGSFIKKWTTINEAKKEFKTTKIPEVCRGERMSCRKFRWTFSYYEKLQPLKIKKNKTPKDKYVYTDEHRNNISIGNRGKKRTEEYCINARNRKLGTKHTDETKRKMSEKRKGKKIHSEEYKTSLRVKVRQLGLDNNLIKVWNSISDALKEYPHAKISECIYKKRKTSYGYKWEKQ